MAASWKLEFVATTLISVCFCLISSSEVVQGQGTPQFPTLIMLGDSTLNAGNNNNINTLAKRNFPPYDIDFPGGIPTGRFSNGKLTSDFLGIISKYSTFIFLYTFQGLNNFSVLFLYILSCSFDLRYQRNNPCIPRPRTDVGRFNHRSHICLGRLWLRQCYFREWSK